MTDPLFVESDRFFRLATDALDRTLSAAAIVGSPVHVVARVAATDRAARRSSASDFHAAMGSDLRIGLLGLDYFRYSAHAFPDVEWMDAARLAALDTHGNQMPDLIVFEEKDSDISSLIQQLPIARSHQRPMFLAYPSSDDMARDVSALASSLVDVWASVRFEQSTEFVIPLGTSHRDPAILSGVFNVVLERLHSSGLIGDRSALSLEFRDTHSQLHHVRVERPN